MSELDACHDSRSHWHCRRLAIIDCDGSLIRYLPRVFKTPEWEVHSLPDGYRSACLQPPMDAFIIDVCPEGRARVDVIERVKRAVPDASVVAVTAYPSLSLALAAGKAGADDCLVKSVDPVELLAAIDARGGKRHLPRSTQPPTLARVEWEYIARVLESVDCNISVAARTLGIQRSTLQRKLKKCPPTW